MKMSLFGTDDGLCTCLFVTTKKNIQENKNKIISTVDLFNSIR